MKFFNCHRRDVNFLWTPLRKLVQCLKYLYSRAQIVFQSILPVEICYMYTVDAFNGYNRMLFDLCREYGCIYYDCFGLFLDFNDYFVDINRDLYADAGMKMKIHLNDRGLKVLCRELKYIIYHNTFNPYVSRGSCYYA